MIRYGIIGCGNIAKFHFHALEKIGAVVTCIADISPDAAAGYAKAFGANFTTDYRELIDRTDVDVVCILASGGVHKDAAERAIARGKGVICEKTMMNNAADAYAIASLAEKSGAIFFTSYMKRFFPAVRQAKALMPELGTVFSAVARSFQAWGNFYSPDHGWNLQGVLDVYGGAIVKCAASHILDMTIHLLGRPDGVYATVDYYPNTKFDRKATAIFEYDSGLAVSFETAAHPLKRIGYERNSWDEFIEITGTAGRLELYTVMWDHPENNAPLLVYYDNKTETRVEYLYDAMNPFDAEIAYFNDCFEEGRSGRPNHIDGYAVDVLIESIFLAAAQGRSVRIDWKDL